MRKYFIVFAIVYALFLFLPNGKELTQSLTKPKSTAQVLDVRLGFWPERTYIPPEYSAQHRFPGVWQKAADIRMSLPCSKGNQIFELPLQWDVLGLPQIYIAEWEEVHPQYPEFNYRYWNDLSSIAAAPYQLDRPGFAGAGKSAGSISVFYVCSPTPWDTAIWEYNYELEWDHNGHLMQGKNAVAPRRIGSMDDYLAELAAEAEFLMN